ncbi:MAG: pyruvate dehydrogenase (acetyl-transferring), homodimeric type [Microthrixaceae bacterium]|nr:pyruvate dehydrogenase (acetyl-transferring), homodimeric type [Microthrixaceae bacterium]MCB9387987.1 pyruvate dehydrogenase (acetyl-transferring), homodimeric type [Microthrixaceae bacterium]MCO5320401.1 pyruvate dehydrogenase (acetyl-transferring), homodimeric type [Microthrixaceae bacterium]
MIIDGFAHQLPDIDPVETEEWLDSLEAVVDQRGRSRAQYLMARLTERARRLAVGTPASISTPYVNTIPPENEPWFPGDEDLERRIRRYIRWNAAAQVVRANKTAEGIGGHLSTFASSAALYEVGFNHFFRGKDAGPGDHVYIQGHASPGIYARAYLEHRLDEADLDRFRREIDTPASTGRGLSSYPHPRLMPDFWEYPTVSMGLGPILSIYQARFNKYLEHRRIDDAAGSRVWCFVGDGECDEPETLGSISLAAREHLDNLTWVINCNLQRLDGPVRGNGKIIQELEAIFRGAGWNVIKVIWGGRWDELLQRDTDSVLLNQMNTTVDGEFQRYAIEDGNYIRENFFGPDPRLRAMVEHLSDEDLTKLPRGGHDYRKIYASYRAAVETEGVPTVILAQTVKGWTLGEGVEGRNSTHQIKKMTSEQLVGLRDRLRLGDVIPDEDLADGWPPFVRPGPDSPETRYLLERRRALDGPLPKRGVPTRRPIAPPAPDAFDELLGGSGNQAASTTTAFTRLLRNLCRDDAIGARIVPIIPDEARTFGMDALFRELGIYASQGQLYEPVDHELLLSYKESSDGQILEEGITEAGGLASWTAAATSHAHRGVPMVPFFTFYSMFGFQRVGDLIWAAADARARGFLMGATAGRTTLMGEGLQHQDGQSQLLASAVPVCRSYDPAFAFEMALIVRDGLARMYPGDGTAGEDVFYYLTIYNENYPMPPMPDDGGSGSLEAGVIDGLYCWQQAPEGSGPEATLLFSGTAWSAAVEARDILAEHYGIRVSLWSATSFQRLRMEALEVERWNRLHPLDAPRRPRVSEILADSNGPVVAVTDFMRAVPDQVQRWIPDGRSFTSLGTDGFGRSDTREALRRFFETDAPHVVVAVLHSMAQSGLIDNATTEDAIQRYGLDPEAPSSWTSN